MGGCCFSSLTTDNIVELNECPPPPSQNCRNQILKDGTAFRDGSWPFTAFFFSDLQEATYNFDPDVIVSENGEQSSNIVYRGPLRDLGFVAVKKFKSPDWQYRDYFSEEAKRVGKLRHERIVNLLGYCCEGDERLLVSDFMPNGTLANRLFHQTGQTMEWKMRMRVAYCIAEALEYCSNAGFESYHNLSAYTVLFDQNGEASLSCFGLMKENKDDQTKTGSVIYRFGTLLVDLLSGKQIPPSQAPEILHGKNVFELIDPNLEENFSAEEAIVVSKLASQCLQSDNIKSLKTKELVTTLATLQTITKCSCVEVSLHELVEKSKYGDISWTQLSPIGDACLRMDLTAIHKLLVMAEYKDDEEVFELSFEEWTEVAKALQDVRQRGDQAFLDQDFETAIDCFSQFKEGRSIVYPSVYARRSLCYLFCNQPEAALQDGMFAEQAFPNWPTALYLQSVALTKLNMFTDSVNSFKDAALLEAKRHQHHEDQS